jgi:hypothetical protein
MNEESVMPENQVIPGVYRHYKGPLYYVLGLSKDSETEEVFVIYRPLYESNWPHLWQRRLSMFCENVEFEGRTVPRFALVAS